jgi:hypothetical protein
MATKPNTEFCSVMYFSSAETIVLDKREGFGGEADRGILNI